MLIEQNHTIVSSSESSESSEDFLSLLLLLSVLFLFESVFETDFDATCSTMPVLFNNETREFRSAANTYSNQNAVRWRGID